MRVFLAQTEAWKCTTLAIIRKHIRDDDLEFRSAMMSKFRVGSGDRAPSLTATRARSDLYFSYYRVFILSL